MFTPLAILLVCVRFLEKPWKRNGFAPTDWATTMARFTSIRLPSTAVDATPRWTPPRKDLKDLRAATSPRPQRPPSAAPLRLGVRPGRPAAVKKDRGIERRTREGSEKGYNPWIFFFGVFRVSVAVGKVPFDWSGPSCWGNDTKPGQQKAKKHSLEHRESP